MLAAIITTTIIITDQPSPRSGKSLPLPSGRLPCPVPRPLKFTKPFNYGKLRLSGKRNNKTYINIYLEETSTQGGD